MGLIREVVAAYYFGTGGPASAFTHLALINAVMHVIRADEKLAAGLQPLSAHDELLPDPPPV